MAIEASTAGLGWKAGLIGGGFLLFVSVLSVVVGLRVVPPAPGKEREDIERRMASGFLCSATLGMYAGYKFAASYDPGWLKFWLDVFAGSDDRMFFAWCGAMAPFVAISALAGFWIVAGVMAYLRKQEGKTIVESLKELRP